MEKNNNNKLISHIPSAPGIYKFLDKEENILYIGKAKNIRKRVVSYFTKNNTGSARLKLLVKKISKVDYTVVETEQDALLLENTLIKKYQPKYNIQLKDDKSYPFICIKNERFPRVFLTRNVIKDGSEYFGPFTSVNKVKKILAVIRRLFPLRNCTYQLSEKNIQKNKFKVCLEYHINNCKGPCEGLQSEEDYNTAIRQVKNILKGNFKPVKEYIQQNMKYHAGNFEFEKANQEKEKLNILKDFQTRSTVVNPHVKDADVFFMDSEKETAFVNYLKVANGAIIQARTIELDIGIEEEKEDIMLFAVRELRSQYKSLSPELILPFKIKYPLEDIKITVPQRGEKRKLLELSEKNVLYFMKHKEQQRLKRKKNRADQKDLLKQVQSDFGTETLPVHIECIDNSNIQGTTPVASVVVFKNGQPVKKEYRHFNIKTVKGANDFASMAEVVYRRYKKYKEENTELPQLIIIDGGKGQLNAAYHALEKLGLEHKVRLIAIAKRLEEIYFPGDPVPLHLDKRSYSLKLVQQIRNEAHRFAINFHRQKRTKEPLKTELTQINNIGGKTAQQLLQEFGSVKKIKEATVTELSAVIGMNKAKLIKEHFSEKQNEL